MSAIRVPLLCAFAGGCLSGVILLGVWRADTEAAIPMQQQLARSNELLAAALAASNAERGREVPNERAPMPAPVARHEVAHHEPATADSEAPAPAGSAVSDVLMDLEAAYRKRLVGDAPAESANARENPTITASTSIASAPPEATREPVAAPAPPAAAVVTPAVAVAPPAVVAAAPVAVAPPPAVAAAPVAPAPVAAPPAEAAPAPIAQRDSRAPVHYGDVNQNTYVTNVRQGDVIVVQQQLAMLQYLQLLGASSAAAGLVQPTRFGRGVQPQMVQRAPAPQFRQFPSTLTNPDNPWGFNFAPPNLVH